MTNPTPHGQVPEALRLAEQYDYGDPAAHSNTWKVAVCTELRRQHAELETLTLYKSLADEYGLSIFKDLKDLGDAGSDVQLLRMGYAAARLEIESLNAQLHAAKQINAAQFRLLAASIPGSALRASHGQASAQAAPSVPSGWSFSVKHSDGQVLQIVADYADWLDSRDRLTSFSAFVNEFGYQERDCKSVYEMVVVPCLAARAAQEGNKP